MRAARTLVKYPAARSHDESGGLHEGAHAGTRHRAAVMRAGPPVRVRLPAGGWQVGFRVRPDGRTAVEVTDPDGLLACMVASIRLPLLSIDGGWAGCACGPAGGRQWWALAVGRVPAGACQPAVTFTRRTRRARHGRPAPLLEAVDGLWVVHDGLWVAAATGHYTHVRLTAQSATRMQRLRLVTPRSSSPAASPPGRMPAVHAVRR